MVHEIHQEADGTLSVAVPHSIDQAFSHPLPISLQPGLGEGEWGEGRVRVAAQEGFGCAVAGEMPERCKIEAAVALEPNTRGAGVMLRCSEDLEAVYLVGGGTHPGSGLPVIYESARITSRLLLQDWDLPHEHCVVPVDGVSCGGKFPNLPIPPRQVGKLAATNQ